MPGYIIYNGIWHAAAPPDPVTRLLAAFAGRGASFAALPNTLLAAQTDTGVSVRLLRESRFLRKGDCIVFWDKDTALAAALEAAGARVFNGAAAIAACDDKWTTHRVLAGHGIPMPRTLLAPMTYYHLDRPAAAGFLRYAADTLGFPMVVKECRGSLGGQVYLAANRTALETIADSMAARAFILQEYVECGRRDRRLYVVGGRTVAAMERRNPNDFRANIAVGGTAVPHTPTARESALAIACCAHLGLDFGGVDLLNTPDGPVVCEVNASAHMAAIAACAGVNPAEEIAEYVLRRMKEGIP